MKIDDAIWARIVYATNERIHGRNVNAIKHSIRDWFVADVMLQDASGTSCYSRCTCRRWAAAQGAFGS